MESLADPFDLKCSGAACDLDGGRYAQPMLDQRHG